MSRIRLLLPVARAAASIAVSVLLVVVLALGVSQHAGWVRVINVQGGSMDPALPYGSLLVTTPATLGGVHVGDVVSLVADDAVRVTHRVVAIDPATGALTTRGDANHADDPAPFTGPGVDLVRAHVPLAGRVLAALNGPARLWAGLAVVLFALAALTPVPVRRPRGAHRADPARTAAVSS